jgi:hypothetical protein
MSDDADTYEAAGQEGPVQLDFVDPPALNGQAVEWTYRTIGGRTAPPGTGPPPKAPRVTRANGHTASPTPTEPDVTPPAPTTAPAGPSSAPCQGTVCG